MLMNDWVELHGLAGELEGMATIMEWTDEIDLKKLKTSLNEFSQKILAIADKEREKIIYPTTDGKPAKIPAKKSKAPATDVRDTQAAASVAEQKEGAKQ